MLNKLYSSTAISQAFPAVQVLIFSFDILKILPTVLSNLFDISKNMSGIGSYVYFIFAFNRFNALLKVS